MSRKRILAIDGGGIRGIIPLCALVRLEEQLGKPCREVFSFISGTSTGAIITGALATGMSAERTLEMYQTLGHQAFEFKLLDFLSTLGSYKYESAPLARLLAEHLGNPTLNELPIDVMFTAMRVRDGRAYYFVKDNPVTLPIADRVHTGAFRLVDCITASAAFPLFFKAWDVPQVGLCIDGGVGIAGNPAYQACVEAFYYSAPGSYPFAETTVVSLGTGYYVEDHSPSNLVEWLRWTIGELLDEPINQQTQLIERHFKPRGVHLVRSNVRMPESIEMDDAKAIPRLIEIGRKAAAALDWNELLKAPDGTRELAPMPLLPRNRP